MEKALSPDLFFDMKENNNSLFDLKMYDSFFFILNEMKGVTIEPTGNLEKSEPQMGFEPTTLRDLVRML